MARKRVVRPDTCMNNHHDERGSTMVEFALVFMLLITVIALVVQGGFYFTSWLGATNAAREGARFGAPCLNRSVLPCTTADVQARASSRAAGFVDMNPDFSVTVSPVTSASREVTVTVRGSVPSVGPLPLNLPVYGVSTMRLEVIP